MLFYVTTDMGQTHPRGSATMFVCYSYPPPPARLSMHVQLSNIAFIKTHKTASTTLASILYRYGKRHDSNISKFKEGGTVVDLASAASQVRMMP